MQVVLGLCWVTPVCLGHGEGSVPHGGQFWTASSSHGLVQAVPGADHQRLRSALPAWRALTPRVPTMASSGTGVAAS